jgi:flagellar biosynthesis chaperone FliJ
MAGLNPRGQNVGAVPQGITDAITNLQQAAGNAATTITNLRTQVKAGMTDAEAQQVQQQLAGIADSLNAAAQEPTPPTP